MRFLILGRRYGIPHKYKCRSYRRQCRTRRAYAVHVPIQEGEGGFSLSKLEKLRNMAEFPLGLCGQWTFLAEIQPSLSRVQRATLNPTTSNVEPDNEHKYFSCMQTATYTNFRNVVRRRRISFCVGRLGFREGGLFATSGNNPRNRKLASGQCHRIARQFAVL